MNRIVFEKAISSQNIEWRKHALQRMFERGISREDVKDILRNGEIIEEYFDDKPFPSMLIFKFINNRPLHIVASLNESESQIFIITAYEPTVEKFESDFKTRRKL
ncbi:MAG: DUF4258 domain-containing protein [Bacteroidota bacterium]